MTIEGWATLLAVGLAFYAAWLMRPRPLSMDWQKLFLLHREGLVKGEFDDPDPAFSPRPALGTTVDWPSLAMWDEATQAALRRTMSSWVFVGFDGDLHQRLAAQFGGRHASAQLEAPVEDFWDFWEQMGEIQDHKSDRFILCTTGEHLAPLLHKLHEGPGLRDATRAVIAVTPSFSDGDQSWLQTHFIQEEMDTELLVPITYLTLGGQPLPQPAPDPKGAVGIDTLHLDMGHLDLGHLDTGVDEADLRALLILLAHKARAW